jgi:hypothetical protein
VLLRREMAERAQKLNIGGFKNPKKRSEDPGARFGSNDFRFSSPRPMHRQDQQRVVDL